MPVNIKSTYKYRDAEIESLARGASFDIAIKLKRGGGTHGAAFWKSKKEKEERAKMSYHGFSLTCPMPIFPPPEGNVCFYDVKKLLRIILGDAQFLRIEKTDYPIEITFRDYITGEGDAYRGMSLGIDSNDPSPVVQKELKEIGDLIYNYFDERMDVIHSTVARAEMTRANKSLFGQYDVAHSTFVRKLFSGPDGRDTVDNGKSSERPQG
jgi:hypothetical protein